MLIPADQALLVDAGTTWVQSNQRLSGSGANGELMLDIVQVIGATHDAEFPEGHLPEIYNALELTLPGAELPLTCEVQQHLGGNRVRAVSMGSTDGVVRNMPITDTGAPISVPVGESTLGRVFNLLGDPIDKLAATA